MKTAKLSVTILTAALTLGFLNPAAAMPAQHALSLNHGSTTPKQVGGTDHYDFELSRSTRVVITSRTFDPISSAHIKLRGQLLDEDGQVVATATRRGGQFTLDRQVPAGRYTLVVDSRNTSAKRDGANQYLLRARLEPQR